jgi:hypothetical protein
VSKVSVRVAAALVSTALVLLATSVGGTPPSVPPLDGKTIVGQWEGISHSEPRLFILRLGTGTSVSLASIVVTTDGTRMVFQIDKTDVTGGRVALRGKGLGDAKTYGLRVAGTGTGFDGHGRLPAEITLTDQNGRRVNSWKVTLVMLPGGYVNRLKELFDAGERSFVEENRLTGR